MPDAGRQKWIGLDIGGAAIKAATTDGFAARVPFALWQQPNDLADAVRSLLADCPPHDAVAAAMTGELADCFETKQRGVSHIVAAVLEAGAAEARFFTLEGSFVSAAEATGDWRRVAAGNWAALARAVAPSLLIDIGSTTTDIIAPATLERTPPPDDTDRLMHGELLYFGVGRTPLCAVVSALPYRGRACPVAAELFATTGDAAMLVGEGDTSTESPTADGRPADLAFASARMARMLCLDPTDFDHEDAVTAAEHVIGELARRVGSDVRRVLGDGRGQTVTVSGDGEWLARRALAACGWCGEVASLGDRLGPEVSRCAPAWAVAELAERLP
ncbi:MAG: hydantoinase/oxoprolinase family protein [Planctomycetota bacterium]